MKFIKFPSLENHYRDKFINAIQMHECSNKRVPWIATEKLHGCFTRSTKILLPDGTTMKIGDIIDNKYDGDVLGVNESGDLVPTKVTNWFRNGKTDKWLKIKYQTYGGRGGVIRAITCTPNHEFFLGGGYTPAEELNVGDELQFSHNSLCLSFIQEQVLLGKMLGDGSICEAGHVSFSHREDDLDYLEMTENALGSICGNRQKNHLSGYGTNMLRGKSISTQEISEYFIDWDKPNGVCPEVDLTPISLMFWYLDDGSYSYAAKQNPRVSLAACRYTLQSCENLVRSLNRLGINATIQGKLGRLRINLDVHSSELLFAYICNMVPNCLHYKIPEEYRMNESGFNLEKQAHRDSKMRLSKAVILSIEEIESTKERYDFETETHNYFANGIHVHNSNYSIWCDGTNIKSAKRSGFIGEGETFFGHEAVDKIYFPKIKALYDAMGISELPTEEKPTLVVYGELVGAGVQKGVNYSEQKEFFVFDMAFVKDGKLHFYDWDDNTLGALAEFGFKTAPVLKIGNFDDIMQLDNLFDSTINAGEEPFTAEGYVAKPVVTAWLNTGSRVCVKSKNDKFSEKGKGTKKVKPRRELSELELFWINGVADYITENRLNNVLSKEGEFNPKMFGKIMNLLIIDAIEEFAKDNDKDYSELAKVDRKIIQNALIPTSRDLVKQKV